MIAIGVRVETLTPLHHSLQVQGGTATLPEFDQRLAFGTALLLEWQACSALPEKDYLRDWKALP